MEMPKLFSLVRIIAQIGAVIGCVIGVIVTFGGLASFKFGFVMGLTATSGGLYMIFGSLAALGMIYCFLAMVQAQIDTRNAVVDFIDEARARK